MNELLTIPMLAPDWVVAVFIAILILLVIVKLLFQERLIGLMLLPFSRSYMMKFSKESSMLFNGFNALTFLIASLIFGLILHAAAVFYLPELEDLGSLLLFFEFCLVLPVYLFLRFTLGVLLAMLFDVKTQQMFLAFVKTSYLFASLLAMAPFLLLTYLLRNNNIIVFNLLVLLFGGLLIVRYVNVVNYNKNALDNQWSNFFLYLCALEIAPILLFLKTIL
ncbi:DUF4271 domain-containing protein [Urechidicola sp. KH5]